MGGDPTGLVLWRGRAELLARASERAGAQHYGAERKESGEAKAERLVREELGRRRKGDAGKVRIARRLRQETTMTLAWIARRLSMGVWTHFSNLLRAAKQSARRG